MAVFFIFVASSEEVIGNNEARHTDILVSDFENMYDTAIIVLERYCKGMELMDTNQMAKELRLGS